MKRMFLLCVLLLFTVSIFSVTINDLKGKLIGTWIYTDKGGAVNIKFFKNKKWKEVITQFSYQDPSDETKIEKSGSYKVFQKNGYLYIKLIETNGEKYKEEKFYFVGNDKLNWGGEFEKKKSKEEIAIENKFNKFFSQFKKDTYFQKNRIKFPLKGTKISSKNKWEYISFSKETQDDIWGNPVFYQKLAVINYKKTETGIYIDYIFKLINKKWYLTAIENDSM